MLAIETIDLLRPKRSVPQLTMALEKLPENGFGWRLSRDTFRVHFSRDPNFFPGNPY